MKNCMFRKIAIVSLFFVTMGNQGCDSTVEACAERAAPPILATYDGQLLAQSNEYTFSVSSTVKFSIDPDYSFTNNAQDMKWYLTDSSKNKTTIATTGFSITYTFNDQGRFKLTADVNGDICTESSAYVVIN